MLDFHLANAGKEALPIGNLRAGWCTRAGSVVDHVLVCLYFVFYVSVRDIRHRVQSWPPFEGGITESLPTRCRTSVAIIDGDLVPAQVGASDEQANKDCYTVVVR